MLTGTVRDDYDDPPTRRDRNQNANTTDFGIQVDLNDNPEAFQNSELADDHSPSNETKPALSQAERRKLNKKLNKKKKREKQRQLQRQARRQIGNIIQQLYERTARFEDYADTIEDLVELIYNNDFRDYLDQLIRMRVTYIQKSIWEYTQSILYQNPFERHEDHIFYSQMVDEIYAHYVEIVKSSQEIEKIINIYLRFAYQKSQGKEQIVYSNLANNTFNYMIETDQTLKNLLHICDKKVSPAKKEQRQKLERLISVIDCYYQDDKDEQDIDEGSTSCPADDLLSTGHSEEDQGFMDKRRRRKKIKESELVTKEQSLIQRLEALAIQDRGRAPCRVSEDWLKRISMKSLKYRAG